MRAARNDSYARSLKRCAPSRRAASACAARHAGIASSNARRPLAVLETRRWKNEKDSFEQWLLYGPDGNVLTLRDDARYSWHQARDAPGTETWHRLPGV